MTMHAALIEKIRAAFYDVLPGKTGYRTAMADDDRLEERDKLAYAKVMISDHEIYWWDIPENDFPHFDNWLFLPKDAFKFFMPAVMSWTLKQPDYASEVAERLLSRLIPGKQTTSIAIRKKDGMRVVFYLAESDAHCIKPNRTVAVRSKTKEQGPERYLDESTGLLTEVLHYTTLPGETRYDAWRRLQVENQISWQKVPVLNEPERLAASWKLTQEQIECIWEWMDFYLDCGIEHDYAGYPAKEKSQIQDWRAMATLQS